MLRVVLGVEELPLSGVVFLRLLMVFLPRSSVSGVAFGRLRECGILGFRDHNEVVP